MKVLFLSWRDIKAPKMGGAEVFTHEMLKRINQENIELVHFSPMFEGAKEEEMIDGVKYVRKGNMLTVLYHSYRYYLKHRHSIDYVVDQCNTHRFFTPFYIPKRKRVFFIHQLTRELWLKNLKAPFSYIGYYMENMITRIYRNQPTLTVSNSTKNDLVAMGFDEAKIYILPEGINFTPWQENEFATKPDYPLFTYVGRYARYKGIDTAIEAFGKIKADEPEAKMWIIGKKNEAFKKDVIDPVLEKYQLVEGKDIIFHGFVSEEDKLRMMSESTALLFASVREGWGLTITEGAAVGTPSIVFNSAGLVDAVDQGKTGYLVDENSVNGLAEKMKLVISNPENYENMRRSAYEFSKLFHWDATASEAEKAFETIEEVNYESRSHRYNNV